MGIEYNQLLSGKVLAEMGNEVTYVSRDNKRIDNIKRGYYNADETVVIKSIHQDNNVDFTANIKNALESSNMCFISEGYTQESPEEMEVILKRAKEIGEHMTKHMFIIDRAAVSGMRIDSIKSTIQQELNKRNEHFTFEIISSPDFLRA